MKTFTINDIKYTVQPCTAICMADQADESNRQKALLIVSETRDEVKDEAVVFGYDMPETDDDFLCMSDDPGAWESDWEVLETVKA